MMDMLIDVTRLVGRRIKSRLPTGIDRVCLAYVAKYHASARAVLNVGRAMRVLSRPASQELFASLLDPAPFAVPVRGMLRAFLGVRQSVAPGSFLLNLGHSGLEQPSYPRWAAAGGLRPIFMVHDLIPLSHPEYCRPREAVRHAIRMRTVLNAAAGVLANSHSTLSALKQFTREEGLRLPPVTVAPLAGAAFPSPEPGRPMPGPYFVMLSTIEPRKNHWTILQAWGRLVGRMGPKAPHLLVIGQRGWECENVVDLLERSERLKGHVTELPRCTDQALATYLHHAQALLFPSLVEGYGLPLIEALSSKVPVIASDLPVFREIADDTPDYLDPLNGAEWVERIADYCSPDSAARQAQARRIALFEAPTWAAHFRQFEQLLGQLS